VEQAVAAKNCIQNGNDIHVGIVMDGNSRWAKHHGVEKIMGHKSGADALEKIAKYANKIGLKMLTVYAFSTENWKRSREEVGYLMRLFLVKLNELVEKLGDENVKIRIIGEIDDLIKKVQAAASTASNSAEDEDITALASDIQIAINKVEEMTKDNTGMVFNIAMNYGARAEILHVFKSLFSDFAKEIKSKSQNISGSDLNNEVFASYLDDEISGIDELSENTLSSRFYTPDVDLVILPGSHTRLSNFLLWQASYAELYVTDTLWPDFSEKNFDDALNFYKSKQRKFGGRPDEVA
jgi:undecaprenyl diphosphate synthase